MKSTRVRIPGLAPALAFLAAATAAAPAFAESVPGRLDATFGVGGETTVDFATGIDYAWSVAAQPDGKVVAAGVAVGANQDFAVARWNLDGTLDATFGSGGKVTTAIGTANEFAKSVVVQPDGKIVAGGPSRTGSYNEFALVRYLANGTLDSTFGTGGKVVTSISSGHDYLNAIALQADGKIVGAGYSNQAGNLEPAVVRWNVDGAPDAGFGTDGRVVIAAGAGIDNLFAVKVQPDGKIVVAGYGVTGSSYDLAVIRLASDGTLDAGFGAGGRVALSVNAYAIAQSIALQPDGKIVVAGYGSNGVDNDVLVVRLAPDGSLDPEFGGGAPVLTPIGSSEDTGRGVALQSDGRIVVAGNSGDGVVYDFAVVRYLADGTLDPAFGTAGKVVTAISPESDSAFGIALLPDERIVAGGSGLGTGTESSFALARYENLVCGNQVVENGEDCDAGASNGTASSCCSATCGLVAAGTTCRPATGACDVAEACDGTSAECPSDEFVEAARASNANLQISRLRFPRGTQDLRFTGRFQPFPSTPAVNPLADGLRLVLLTATGRVVFDTTLPGGAYDAARRIGWKSRVSAGRTIYSWTHSSTSVAAPGGIVSASVTPGPTGLSEVTVLGKSFDYLVDPGEQQIRFTLVARPAATPASQCGDMVNGASGGPTCQFRDTGRTLRCQ